MEGRDLKLNAKKRQLMCVMSCEEEVLGNLRYVVYITTSIRR